MSLRELVTNLGPAAICVVLVMFGMSVWSIGVMIDRMIAFSATRKQSRLFAPAVAGALREGHLDEAVLLASRYKRSHLAKVLVAGLQEFQAHQSRTSCNRALDRAQAIVSEELERGLSGLATIASTAPFVGLFGTVVGIINAFHSVFQNKEAGLTSVAGGISEALVTTAIGLFVAVPAIWMYNYFMTRVKKFGIEMENSSSELMDYFLQRAGL